MKMEICLRIPTVLWIGGRTTLLTYWMFIMLVILGRYKCIRLNHWYLVSFVLKWKLLLQNRKSINDQVVIKFRQNWFKQEAKYYCQRSTNTLILFGIRRNCLINGGIQLLYQSTRRVIKVAVIIIVGYHCYQLHTKCYRISSSQG
jgi:hypothetical protein